jgi:PAS domain S-box-containing protein
LYGVVLVFRDFTERKQAEEKLQDLLARFESLVEYAPIAIALFDSELRFISANDRLAEINGLPKDAHFGKRPGELFPGVGERVEEYLRQVRDTGQPVLRVELTGETPAKPGEQRHWIASYYPVRHPNGKVYGIGAMALEVTEQKRAEEALREAHEQLASRALHLERLVQQRTTRLNEMIGDLEGFSYSIVHDMRGPLRAMNSFTQLLQEECGHVSPTAQNYMQRIRTAAVRMDRLIQDGLNYSRLMRAELPLVPVDAAALVRGILETYPMLQPPNATIELSGTFPLVKANEATLTQCVSNLLGNAVKFVAPGVSPHVRVWAEARGERVRLFFTDNGIGIPASAHERIFQIFQRIDNTYEGTGIGLAIVKKAAERMGGTVGLESEPGKGSTFWIELARAESAESTLNPSSPSGEARIT